MYNNLFLFCTIIFTRQSRISMICKKQADLEIINWKKRYRLVQRKQRNTFSIYMYICLVCKYVFFNAAMLLLRILLYF